MQQKRYSETEISKTINFELATSSLKLESCNIIKQNCKLCTQQLNKINKTYRYNKDQQTNCNEHDYK